MKPGPPPTDTAHDVLRQERQPLDVIFSPRNVAVIGATEKAGSVGRTSTRDVGAMKLGGGLRAAGP